MSTTTATPNQTMGLVDPRTASNGVVINISNHPSAKWSDKQIETLKALAGSADGTGAEIMDVSFPQLDPADNGRDWNLSVPIQLCSMLAEAGFKLHSDGFANIISDGDIADTAYCMGLDAEKTVFFITGEPVWCHHAVTFLISEGYRCCTSTSERKTVETVNPDGTVTKTSQFCFVGIRAY